MFPRMADILQPGVVGTAAIDHFEMTKQQSEATLLRAAVQRDPDEFCPPGTYARLRVDGSVMMTDTLMERWSNEEVVRRATGKVLIAGLGLGMILHPICAKKSVQSVHVIEKNADVISLVVKTVPPKAQVVEGDIFTWTLPRGAKYDTIYFDIWPHICEDNLKEIQKLRSRFRRHLAKDGWMGAWKEEDLRHGRRRMLQLDPYHDLVKCGERRAVDST